jgi:hypothetical protein
MQGVFIVVVAGGPRLGDLRAGATAAFTSTTFSWVGGGIVCAIVVLIAAILVRPFWHYDAGRHVGQVSVQPDPEQHAEASGWPSLPS